MKIFSLNTILGQNLITKNLLNFVKKLVVFGKKKIIKIELAILLLIILLVLIFDRSVLTSFLLTSEVVPGFPVKPLSVLGKKVIKEQVEFTSGDKKIKAVVYRPNDIKSHPVIIFSVGTGTLAANDLSLGHFSKAMAKIGIVAFIPEVPLLAQEYVLKESIPDYISAFEYVFRQPYAKKDKIGFGGFCVGGSLSFVAATNRQISDKVAYLVLISPYFDNKETVKAVVTKTEVKNGQVLPWQPDKLSEKVARNSFLAYLTDKDERQRLDKLLADKSHVNDPDAQFSKNAQLIIKTFNAQSREEFDEVAAGYPEEGKRNLELLSPRNFVRDLNPNTKVFVLSDKKDTFVPESETLAFRNLIGNIRFTEIDSFEHVRPGIRLPRLAAIKQSVKLYLFLKAVLKEVV